MHRIEDIGICPLLLPRMAPIVKITNVVLKFLVSGHATYSNHRNPPREWDQKLTYCESGFEPSVLQTLMYDIPLLSNFIVLHPLIYVSFHSSYWCKTELEEETLSKFDIPCHHSNLMLSNRIVCVNYRIYPHIINFVWG